MIERPPVAFDNLVFRPSVSFDSGTVTKLILQKYSHGKYSFVHKWQPTRSGSLPSVQNEHWSTWLVKPVIHPVPLFERVTIVPVEVIQRLLEVQRRVFLFQRSRLVKSKRGLGG